MNNTMNILETITEEINLKFDDLAIAKVKGEYIHLISQNRRAKDCWEMEQQMEEIFEYVIDKFDVELNIVNYGQRTLVVEVYTYQKIGEGKKERSDEEFVIKSLHLESVLKTIG